MALNGVFNSVIAIPALRRRPSSRIAYSAAGNLGAVCRYRQGYSGVNIFARRCRHA